MVIAVLVAVCLVIRGGRETLAIIVASDRRVSAMGKGNTLTERSTKLTAFACSDAISLPRFQSVYSSPHWAAQLYGNGEPS